MKCRRHPLDDGVGVCSFCLSERLHTVFIDVSAPAYTAESSPYQPNPDIDHLSSEPLPFTRSTSRHFNCIQTGASDATDETRPGDGSDVDGICRRRGKLSFLSAFLGDSRSEERGGDPTTQKPTRASGSWFLALIDRIRKKKQMLTRLTLADNGATAADRRGRRPCGEERGMSPDRFELEISGYDTDSPGAFRRSEVSPKRWTTPQQQHLGRGLAGFAICLIPFMKTSSARRRKQLLEVTYSGQISQQLAPHRRRRRGGPSFAPSRRARG